MSDTTGSTTPDEQRTALEAMRMAELQALAADLQIVGAGKLRKGELVDAVSDARGGRTAASVLPPTGRRRGSRRVSAVDPSEFAGAEVAPGAPSADAGQRRAADHVAAADLGIDGIVVDAVDEDAIDADAETVTDATADDAVAEVVAADDDAAADTADVAADEAVADDAEQGDAEPREPADGDAPATGSRSRRSRSRNRNGGGQQQNGQQPAQQQSGQQQAGQQQAGQAAGPRDGDDDRTGRTSRTRDRKRGRGPIGDEIEPEILEDDVLIPIAGILDVLENYAFVRTTGYLPGPTDVYVSLGQVKKYHLRKGDAVVGAIRQPRDNEPQARQKYNALAKVDSINGLPVDQSGSRAEFDQLAAIAPTERLRLETVPTAITARVVDLFAPIGKGQRALVVGAPKSGKSTVLQAIAESIAKNSPEVHLMAVLVDGRPEEVAELRAAVKGEVIASTFDRTSEDHVTIAELAVERAKRLVELGHDVVVLLDSLSRLGRAAAAVSTNVGRAPAVGVDPAALQPVKRIFASARNLDEQGSLTIIATALVETGSRLDEAIIEELADAATAELRLSRALADRRIYPAVDVIGSGTRREETLLGTDELRVLAGVRRTLAEVGEQAAIESVLGRLTQTGSNVEYLALAQKSAAAGQ